MKPSPVDRSAPYLVRGRVTAIRLQRGLRRDGRVWRRWSINVGEEWYSTFDAGQHDIAAAARAAQVPVWIEYAPTPFGRDVLQIVINDQDGYRP